MDQYQSLRKITRTDYKQFLQSHSEVQIEETTIKLHNNWKIHNFAPSIFTPETTTVWSFPDRGEWATHVGNYRGNWSPCIPRNLILRYTAPSRGATRDGRFWHNPCGVQAPGVPWVWIIAKIAGYE